MSNGAAYQAMLRVEKQRDDERDRACELEKRLKGILCTTHLKHGDRGNDCILCALERAEGQLESALLAAYTEDTERLASSRAMQIEIENRDLQVANDRLQKERDHLLERQDAHLRLIAHMSRESIDEKEAKELRGQMAALIAEVGTLRSRVEELEKKR